MDKHTVYETNSFYWDTKGNDYLGAIVLPYYGAFVSEEKCRLFGDVSGKRMLEIGCGNGQSLQYQGEHGVFIFSWSHPIHKCVGSENDVLTFRKSYFDDS